MNVLSSILGLLLIGIHIGYYFEIIRTKKINFILAIPLVLLSMVSFMIVYFLLENLPNRKNFICFHCGNSLNETEKCGICGQSTLNVLETTINAESDLNT